MHIHILGICGTFMGGLALIARAAGHKVTGCDKGVYPPMSTQLEEQGIELTEGFSADQTKLAPDLYIIGNVISRNNPLIEAILNQKLPYISGPQWLGENILAQQHVLAVAGTHGKTTTSSMLTWILEYNGMEPNFLIGGVAHDLGISARFNPNSTHFVIEADEYDTAFFDKRSKFVHYHARTTILNNLEYDHADIFSSLKEIQVQFSHLVRTIPNQGLIIKPMHDSAIEETLKKGCWTPTDSFGDDACWNYRLDKEDGSLFTVINNHEKLGQVQWNLTGLHNVNNAIAAIAAANHVGIKAAKSIKALCQFQGVRRRMEICGKVNNITIYDDFAHHPTAIQTTLEGLRKKVGKQRIIAIFELRSNTMRLGSNAERLPESLEQADYAFCFTASNIAWDIGGVFAKSKVPVQIFNQIDALIQSVCNHANPHDHIVIMSNGAFEGIQQKLPQALSQHFESTL